MVRSPVHRHSLIDARRNYTAQHVHSATLTITTLSRLTIGHHRKHGLVSQPRLSDYHRPWQRKRRRHCPKSSSSASCYLVERFIRPTVSMAFSEHQHHPCQATMAQTAPLSINHVLPVDCPAHGYLPVLQSHPSDRTIRSLVTVSRSIRLVRQRSLLLWVPWDNRHRLLLCSLAVLRQATVPPNNMWPWRKQRPPHSAMFLLRLPLPTIVYLVQLVVPLFLTIEQRDSLENSSLRLSFMFARLIENAEKHVVVVKDTCWFLSM